MVLKQLLPSGYVETQTKQRTYCPSTYQYAEEFYTPGKYSEMLVRASTPPELAHERVLTVVCNMSRKKKNNKHWFCAASHAPTTVASGRIVPLSPYYQPKTDRKPSSQMRRNEKCLMPLNRSQRMQMSAVSQQFYQALLQNMQHYADNLAKTLTNEDILLSRVYGGEHSEELHLKGLSVMAPKGIHNGSHA